MSVSHPHTATAHHPELGFLRKYIFSTDHKIIGIQFLFSTLIFLAIGGTLAMLVRLQLGWPHADIPILGRLLWPGSLGERMPPETYNNVMRIVSAAVIGENPKLFGFDFDSPLAATEIP